MLGLVFIFWLYALILLPFIWWLHRHQFHKKTKVVSSLIYWQDCVDDTQIKVHGKRRNPLWILRALFILMLILSLAGLYWSSDSLQKISIWVDDSFSMQTLEQGVSRKQRVTDLVIEKLKSYNNVQVEFHSLSDAERPVLLLTSSLQSEWKAKITAWYKIFTSSKQLPLAIDFSEDSEHWLVTDSASQGINEWANKMPFSQLILSGQVSENSAISSLSLRPSLKDNSLWIGLVQLEHFGKQPTQRQLELFVGGNRVKQWDVRFEPFQTKHLAFDLGFSDLDNNTLEAHFVKSDALAKDDSLSLQLKIERNIQIIGLCPSALLTAIKVHPFIKIVKSTVTGSDLSIICASEPRPTEGSSIQFYVAKHSEKVTSTPVWQPLASSLNKLYLPVKALRIIEHKKLSLNSSPLLISNQTILLTLNELNTRRIDCYIDINEENFVEQAEYPVFIAGLIELALNRTLLNNIQAVKRPIKQSQIQPLALKLEMVKAVNPIAYNEIDLVPFLIIAAAVIILFDLWWSAYYLSKEKD